MTTKYFVNEDGEYLGAFSGYQPDPVFITPGIGEENFDPYWEDPPVVWPIFPVGAIEVSTAPADARQIWKNGKWSAVPTYPATRITAAQFRQQLIIDGKDDAVLPAITAIEDETKRKLILARYEFEAFFLRDDPDLLLLAGAVGYNTPKKIQDFFNSAAQIGA